MIGRHARKKKWSTWRACYHAVALTGSHRAERPMLLSQQAHSCIELTVRAGSTIMSSPSDRRITSSRIVSSEWIGSQLGGCVTRCGYWRISVINPYTSDDFAAFLTYAGPPLSKEEAEKRLHSGALQSRLDYVGECDKFCSEYFHTPARIEYDANEWVEFYTEFIHWYRIRQEMQDEIDGNRQGVSANKQDT